MSRADRDGDLAVVNIDRVGRAGVVPAARRAAAVRRVGCRTPATSRRRARRAAARRAARARRARRRPRRSRRATAFDVRRAVAPALRRGGLFVDRRHRARGEPHRRAGHEPRSAGCRDPRAAARAVGAHRRAARRRARRGGSGAASRPRGPRPRSRRSTPRSGGPSARRARRCGARACGSPCCRRARGCSPTRTRWGSTATPDRHARRDSREMPVEPVASAAVGDRGRHGPTSGGDGAARRDELRGEQQRGEHDEPEERRVGGRTSASTAVATATTTTAPKKSHDSGDTARGRRPTSRAAPRARPTMIPAAATTAERARRGGAAGRERRCAGRRRGRAGRSSGAPPRRARRPRSSAHGAATRGSGATSVASDGKIPKLTRNGTIENGVDFSARVVRPRRGEGDGVGCQHPASERCREHERRRERADRRTPTRGAR